jgi:hypothetical protein
LQEMIWERYQIGNSKSISQVYFDINGWYRCNVFYRYKSLNST